MSDKKCEVPPNLSDYQTCTCVADGNDSSSTRKCSEPGSCQCGDVNDKPGISPLHVACTGTNLQVILFLLEKGAAVNAVTVSKFTPLQVCESILFFVHDVLCKIVERKQ